MKADEINKLLENVATPIYQIEAELGMPKTTLNQVLKGKRKLPKKWAIELRKKYQPETIHEIKEELLPEKVKAKIESKETKSPPPNLSKTETMKWWRNNR